MTGLGRRALVVATVATASLVAIVVTAMFVPSMLSLSVAGVVGLIGTISVGWLGWRKSGVAAVIVFIVHVLNRPLAVSIPENAGRHLTLLDDVLLVVLVAVVLIPSPHGAPWRGLLPRVAWWGFAVFGIAGTIGALSWQVSIGALPLGMWVALKLPVAIVAIVRLRWDTRSIRVLLWACVALVSLDVVVLVIEAFAPLWVEDLFVGSRDNSSRLAFMPSLFGYFGHPVQAATVLLFVAAVGLCAPLAHGWRWFGAAAAIISLVGLRVKTIIDVLAIAVAKVFFFVSRVRSVFVWSAMAIVALPVFMVASVFAVSRFDSVVRSDDSVRGALLGAAFEISRDHLPFGTGFGTFGSEASRVYYSPVWEQYGLSDRWGFTVENPQYMTDLSWATLLGEAGVLGAAGIAAVMIALLWRQAVRTLTIFRQQRRLPGSAGASRKSRSRRVQGSWSLASLAFLLVIVIDSFASPRLFDGTAAVALGILLSLSNGERRWGGERLIGEGSSSVKPAPVNSGQDA